MKGRMLDVFEERATAAAGYNLHMRVSSGKVVSGKIVVEGEPLPEGSVVTVLAGDADEPFEIDAATEAVLLESIAQAERGQVVPSDQVLRRLREQA
jgi:hypothetical protein